MTALVSALLVGAVLIAAALTVAQGLRVLEERRGDRAMARRDAWIAASPPNFPYDWADDELIETINAEAVERAKAPAQHHDARQEALNNIAVRAAKKAKEHP